ncbi:MAG: hypothetical protein ACI9SJ_000887 [Flavobacteriaceae bacterium]|jgi:uncharacterized protein (DUF2141 family)|uniref:DUF2141 domain-containing protein n=1 Tax=Candidatus Marifrigoribacter sp. Uisw_064 TaxID=3230970 RepID=UPI003AEA306F
MKTILFTIALSVSSLFISAQSDTNETIVTSEGTTITVTVTLQGTAGTVLFSLHNESTFMKNPLEAKGNGIVDGKSTVTFENIQPGIYGIIILHDKNDNKRMDFQDNGMPMEAFGMSNNVMSFGPPQWSDAKFTVENTPLEMEIRL